MVIRIGLCFAAALSFTGCAALSSQISEGMAPQISTDVAVQVRTEVAIQVGTAIADQSTLRTAPLDTLGAVAELPYDCEPKYCKDMTSCEEAVYQLTVCGYGRLDANNDGVPCESICTAAAFVAVTVIPPTSAPIEKSV